MLRIFDKTPCVLGEGPLWLGNRLYWVDIKSSSILSKGIHDDNATIWSYSTRPSALGKIENSPHHILVAFEEGVYRVALENGQRTHQADYGIDSRDRSNDGAIGPDGCFWIGTMDDLEERSSGSLLRYNGHSMEVLLSGIGISNTVVWSRNGDAFYFADSQEQIIWKFDMDASGVISNRQEFVSLKGTDIYPDGSVVDAQGYLWNAQWGGSRVVRYSPLGEVDTIIPVPVSQPTCCAFGGEKYNKLFITTASIGVDEEKAGYTYVFEGMYNGFSEPYFCK